MYMRSSKQNTQNSSILANERSLKKDIEFFYAKRKQRFNVLLTNRNINSVTLNISKNKKKKWAFRSLEPQKMARFEWLFKKDFLKKKKFSILLIITLAFNFVLRFFYEYKLIFEIFFLFFFFSGFWLNFLD